MKGGPACHVRASPARGRLIYSHQRYFPSQAPSVSSYEKREKKSTLVEADKPAPTTKHRREEGGDGESAYRERGPNYYLLIFTGGDIALTDTRGATEC